MKIKVGIVGATGYAGAELVRILLNHPNAEIAAVSSVSFEGKKLSDVYPNFRGLCDDILCGEDELIEKSDVVFTSVPHGVGESIAKKTIAAGKKFIDLGADFRLSKEADYKEWYGGNYHEPDLHKKAVYGLPELFYKEIKNADLIANPGCYPTSIALGLAPAMEACVLDLKTLVIDAKSGVTGAGRGLSQTTHYPDCNEAFAPYKIASHRHTPEIEETLSTLCGFPVTVTFVPHLLPVNRGIVSTMYATLNKMITMEELRALYTHYYQDKQFVRVLPDGEIANLRNVKYSNYCDISLHFDQRTNRLIVVSCIDNMVKGAAGQAIQNMNLITGLPEDAGLTLVPPAF